MQMDDSENSDDFTQSSHLLNENLFSESFPTNRGFVYEPGARVEILDVQRKSQPPQWYPGKIVEIDNSDGTLLLHFDYWSSKYDIWLPASSDRLRPPSSNTSTPRQQLVYSKEEYVFGRWGGNTTAYLPAKVLDIKDNRYHLLFYDGFSRWLTNKSMKKMTQGDINEIDESTFGQLHILPEYPDALFDPNIDKRVFSKRRSTPKSSNTEAVNDDELSVQSSLDESTTALSDNNEFTILDNSFSHPLKVKVIDSKDTLLKKSLPRYTPKINKVRYQPPVTVDGHILSSDKRRGRKPKRNISSIDGFENKDTNSTHKSSINSQTTADGRIKVKKQKLNESNAEEKVLNTEKTMRLNDNARVRKNESMKITFPSLSDVRSKNRKNKPNLTTTQKWQLKNRLKISLKRAEKDAKKLQRREKMETKKRQKLAKETTLVNNETSKPFINNQEMIKKQHFKTPMLISEPSVIPTSKYPHFLLTTDMCDENKPLNELLLPSNVKRYTKHSQPKIETGNSVGMRLRMKDNEKKDSISFVEDEIPLAKIALSTRTPLITVKTEKFHDDDDDVTLSAIKKRTTSLTAIDHRPRKRRKIDKELIQNLSDTSFEKQSEEFDVKFFVGRESWLKFENNVLFCSLCRQHFGKDYRHKRRSLIEGVKDRFVTHIALHETHDSLHLLALERATSISSSLKTESNETTSPDMDTDNLVVDRPLFISESDTESTVELNKETVHSPVEQSHITKSSDSQLISNANKSKGKGKHPIPNSLKKSPLRTTIRSQRLVSEWSQGRELWLEFDSRRGLIFCKACKYVADKQKGSEENEESNKKKLVKGLEVNNISYLKSHELQHVHIKNVASYCRESLQIEPPPGYASVSYNFLEPKSNSETSDLLLFPCTIDGCQRRFRTQHHLDAHMKHCYETIKHREIKLQQRLKPKIGHISPLLTAHDISGEPVKDTEVVEEEEPEESDEETDEEKELFIVRCSCGRAGDKGYMIMCDLCSAWQHGRCYGLTSDDPVPDPFLCNVCKCPPGIRDSYLHRALTQQRWHDEGILPTVGKHVSKSIDRSRQKIIRDTNASYSEAARLTIKLREITTKLSIVQQAATEKNVAIPNNVQQEFLREIQLLDKNLEGLSSKTSGLESAWQKTVPQNEKNYTANKSIKQLKCDVDTILQRLDFGVQGNNIENK